MEYKARCIESRSMGLHGSATLKEVQFAFIIPHVDWNTNMVKKDTNTLRTDTNTVTIDSNMVKIYEGTFISSSSNLVLLIFTLIFQIWYFALAVNIDICDNIGRGHTCEQSNQILMNTWWRLEICLISKLFNLRGQI